MREYLLKSLKKQAVDNTMIAIYNLKKTSSQQYDDSYLQEKDLQLDKKGLNENKLIQKRKTS